MYSLPITPNNYTVYAHHFGTAAQSNDYYLDNSGPQTWQYALDVDPVRPGASLAFSRSGYAPGAAPFNHSGWPTVVSAVVRPIPAWRAANNSAAVPPVSPACGTASAPGHAAGDARLRGGGGACGAAQRVQLVPHGGTELRIGEFPIAFHQ